ncbi:hypothetical protein BJ322DRAFT_1112888 [Thelephora terrestris]|uniref:Uncharacterized protein n=1 Tax=Thelephora terrestris TaxID=56493 RepID=A0A9P6H631_9AGAM|nr:hypothetical protein BJ322DRAFT_1112888 [Thelephora terrestris]
MSTTSTPDESPMHIQPLHNPSQAAVPLGNNNGQMGLGTRALLSKRLAKEQNPKFVSPTDKMVTPVSQKLNAARKKHFDKGKPKPMSLFASNEPSSQEDDRVSDDGEAAPAQNPPATDSASDTKMVDNDDESPF